MIKYPSSVITKDRKGNKEVRLLVDKGKFARYQYMDPLTGKMSIILKNFEGMEEHLYIIPLQPNKSLVIKPKGEKKGRRVWNGESNEEEELFD